MWCRYGRQPHEYETYMDRPGRRGVPTSASRAPCGGIVTLPADFTTMTVDQVAAFVVAHQDELDVGNLTEVDVTDAIASGRAVLEKCAHGFAIIERKPTATGGAMPHLWLLFLSPQYRNQGHGRRFVRELLRLYSAEDHMSLYCHGARRRAFFGRLGFRVESREGDMRRMTTSELR